MKIATTNSPIRPEPVFSANHWRHVASVAIAFSLSVCADVLIVNRVIHHEEAHLIMWAGQPGHFESTAAIGGTTTNINAVVFGFEADGHVVWKPMP